MNKIIKFTICIIAPFFFFSGMQAQSLDQLLQDIRAEKSQAQAENQRRINEFQQNRNQQRELLNAIEAEVKQQDALSKSLSVRFDVNDQKLTELEEQLNVRLGDLGEVVGAARQIAGDGQSLIANSLISAGKNERAAVFAKLADSSEFPSVEEMESMWLTLLEEISESSNVKRYSTNLRNAKGERIEGEIVRIGNFNAVYKNNYLKYEPQTNELQVLEVQPSGRFTATAGNLYKATSGTVPFYVDPSGGKGGGVLKALSTKPNWVERFRQGGSIGYIIIALGIVGLLIALYRLVYLMGVGGRVRSQFKNKTPKTNNPLGRILSSYSENSKFDTETLELKIDEAILKETPRLERWQGALKIIAAIAPLLGLLGTVVGMIDTFQSITLFGTGDPKLMADGISKALVTTMLGLIVAVPIVLLHSWVTSKSRGLIEILEEQSAGLIAKHAESNR